MGIQKSPKPYCAIAFLCSFTIVLFADLTRIGWAQQHRHNKEEVRLIAFKENNKWGYKDLSDKIIIKAQYDSATNFKEGVALIRNLSEYYLINPEGEIIRGITSFKSADAIPSIDIQRTKNKKGNINLPAYRVQSSTNCFPNFDFEDGDFRNWETSTGRTDDVNMVNYIYQSGSWNAGINDAGPPNRHQLIDRQSNAGELDYYGGFPVNHPRGGRYSLKLGSSEDDPGSSQQWPNRRSESVRYKIRVPSNDFSILVSYAVVFEYPQNGSLYCASTHCEYEQPRFKAVIYRPNGDTLQCFNFTFIASDPLPGFKLSPIPGNIGSQVRYRDWTDVFINLSKFSGDEVFLEITTADCTLGGHWGYGYFDVIECDYKIKLQNSCRTPQKTLLFGPDGPFKGYTWLDQNNQVLSNKKIDSINAFPANTKIRLALDPFDGYGCKDTIDAIVGNPQPPSVELGPSQPNCGNAGVIIGVPNNSLYAYQWTPSVGLSSTTASQVTANPTNATTYKLSVTDNLTGCKADDDILIRVERGLNINVNDATTCANKAVTLTATGADSYTWSPSTGLNTNTGNTVSASPIFSTAYTVTGKSNTTGCEARKQATVTIDPAFQISAVPINPTDCNAVQGAILVSNLDPNKKYLISYSRNGISFPDNAFTSNAAGQIEIKNLPIGLYTNFFAELNGCGSNVIGPIRLIGPDIPRKPSLPGKQINFCPGQTTTPIQFISTDNAIIEWTNSNTTIGLAAGGTGIITPFIPINNTTSPLEATIIVKAKLNGCPGPADTMKIIINPAPRIIVNNPEVCIGSSVKLVASGADTYSWSPTTDLNISTGAEVFASPLTQTTYTVTGTFSSTGCGASANAIVKVNPLPTGNLVTTGTQNVCANAQRTFQVTAGQPNTGFQWLLNGQVVSGATSRSLTTGNEGSYTVELTSFFGCKALATGTVDLVQIIKPEADFDAPIVCIGNSTTFRNSTNIARSGVVKWEWDFGDGTGSTIKDPVKKYNFSGTYKVTLRASSQTCPGLNDTIQKIAIVQDPLPGIRYPTIEGLINTNIPLRARNIGSKFLWNPSAGLNNPNIIDPVFRYDRDTEYLIRITSLIGCETVDTILLRVHNAANIFVPDAFTPNGDGSNDFLDIFVLGANKIHFWVFNRWGQLMFETTDPKQRWDGIFQGKPQPLENYVWIAELETFTGQRIKKRGQTILIR